MNKLRLGAMFAAIALLCGRPAGAQVQVVSVSGGRVAGVLAEGITSFKGIAFAAPPVGALRWRAPQPVKRWTGVKQADHFGPSCMQGSGALNLRASSAMSEDCLYLNVWTPARSARARLPVMVWIYGGGFNQGTTSRPLYDGTRLATKGVVLVSLAYRLGVFGFLADPELSAESSHHVSGNYGLRDQIAGLRWVRANIARFGGDPARVTIFGESAGGASVMILAASPAARGLFQRVISESGDVRSWGPPKLGKAADAGAVRSLAEAEAAGRGFLTQLGAPDIAAARALPADVLQRAQLHGLQSPFVPVLDGDVLPGNEYERYQARQFNDTPVLVGTNADEGAAFVARGTTPAQFEAQIRAGFGDYAGAVLAAYPHATEPQSSQAAMDVFRDRNFAWAAWTWATLESQNARGKAYLFYFDQRAPWFPRGPIHGAELPYVFGNFGVPSSRRRGGMPGPADLALSDLMESYWVNFAKTGDPNGPGLALWPAFGASSQKAMFLDAEPGAHAVPNMQQIKALDAYFAWRRQEATSKQGN